MGDFEQMLKKNELRKQMKEKRDALSKEEIVKAGDLAAKMLLTQACFDQYDIVYLYASAGSELDTHAIFSLCHKLGKRVAFPKVHSKESMEFYEVTDISKLHKGAFGISEPEECLPVMRKKGLMLLPGLAFDRQNNRMGYGAGYYDRYLSQFDLQHFYKVGLCYDFQLQKEIPVNDMDVPLNQVISISLSS